MQDSGFLEGYGTRQAPRRSGLVAGALPLALLVPVWAAVYAVFKLIRAFALVAEPQGGVRIAETCTSLWALQRFAWGGLGALCIVGLLVGLARFNGTPDGARCSVRRGLVLLLLPLLGLLTVGTHTYQFARILRVSVAVVASSDENDPVREKALESVLVAEGLVDQSPGRVSAFIARSMVIVAMGGFVIVVVLLGLASTGFILSWRVGLDGPLLVATSAVWVLAALFASLVFLGALDPLELP